jgi:hypothetical protein
MLVTFNRSFAGFKAGETRPVPDGVAMVLIRKGYAAAPDTAAPVKKPRKPRK